MYVYWETCKYNTEPTIFDSLAEPAAVQVEQVTFWLSFLQSRIPPVEPLGDTGRSHKAKLLHIEEGQDLNSLQFIRKIIFITFETFHYSCCEPHPPPRPVCLP